MLQGCLVGSNRNAPFPNGNQSKWVKNLLDIKFVPPLIEDNFKDLKLEFRLSQIFINDHSCLFLPADASSFNWTCESAEVRSVSWAALCVRAWAQIFHIHSPDEEQNASVQTPLEWAEPDALDPDQLVGFILTQSAQPAARHGDDGKALRAGFLGLFVWFLCGGGISDSFLNSSSCVDGHMATLLQMHHALSRRELNCSACHDIRICMSNKCKR